jgi:3-deoxy-manno-octulosonate cytidylyltransferase (CMP-KDO synthetase)
MRILGIIPARYASSRFPGKPLADIGGKPMIQRVYEQAKKARSLSDVIVATDDARIEQAVKRFNGTAVMTSAEHKSGTDRCFEALKRMKNKYDVVINIQGDEPFIHPGQVDAVASCFKDRKVEIATLAREIKKAEELINPNVPKVIVDKKKFAIYFSRSPLPYLRGKYPKAWVKGHTYLKHIGIYAYRCAVLEKITRLEQSPLELAEMLEQLRWLENGYKIKVEFTTRESVSVDTPGDLAAARQVLKKLLRG